MRRAQLFKRAMASFRKMLHAAVTRPLVDTLMAIPLGDVPKALFPLFAQHAVSRYSEEIQAYRCVWQAPVCLPTENLMG